MVKKTDIYYCNQSHTIPERVIYLKLIHTLCSMTCFPFSTLAKVSSRSSMSFFSSEPSSSSFLFLALSSAFKSSSSSSLSLNSLALASSKMLFLISPSHRSSASARLTFLFNKNNIYICGDILISSIHMAVFRVNISLHNSEKCVQMSYAISESLKI